MPEGLCGSRVREFSNITRSVNPLIKGNVSTSDYKLIYKNKLQITFKLIRNKLRRILELNADEKQCVAFTLLSSNREITTEFLQFSVRCVLIRVWEHLQVSVSLIKLSGLL